MNTPESEFDLIPCDSLLAKLEENLSAYTMNGLLDTEQFYPEIKWMISQLGLAVFERTSAVIRLKDYQQELPCDFYLLDSAWLCDKNGSDSIEDSYWQGKYVFFTTTQVDSLTQDQSCPPPNNTGWSVNACDNTATIDSVTVTEYVTGAPGKTITWRNPILLKLNNRKNIGKICSNKCKNLFASSPYEISINKKHRSYFLTSTLKEPVIYLYYWKYPIDAQTQLPLIPNDPIIQKALESHLTHWLLIKLWTNSEIQDAENKVKYWEQRKQRDVAEAKLYCKFPSFNKMVDSARTARKRWNTYEQIMSYHW